jgi:hypothetical protein
MPSQPRRRPTRAQARQAFLDHAAQVWDELTEWTDTHPDAPLTDIEQEVTHLRRRLVGEMVDLHFRRGDGGAQLDPPGCVACGQPMRYKGEVDKTIQTTEGIVTLGRAYYACDHCEGGLFPPGPPTAPGTNGVE